MDSDQNDIVEIDQNILNETIHCDYDFECLKNKNFLCKRTKVENFISRKVLFINCNNLFCKYRMNFGDGVICHCPTRKEIYNKYQI